MSIDQPGSGVKDSTGPLLDAIRRAAGAPGLSWAAPPERLSGGFWAEMYIVRLAGAPLELSGDLVARIMPDPQTAARETAVQDEVATTTGLAPAVLLHGPPEPGLDRAWMLMPRVDGQPLISDLAGASIVRDLPRALRRLPGVLASASAQVHSIDARPLAERLSGRHGVTTAPEFIAHLGTRADAAGRADLAAVARRLLASQPANNTVSVTHGDLHPFNVLISGERTYVVDWSNALLADPHFDLAFTTLMLAHPPVPMPGLVRPVIRAGGRALAKRFLRRYARQRGQTVDARRLAWHTDIHALRILIETSGWDAAGTRAEHRDHPWMQIEQAMSARFGLARTIAT